MAMREEDSDSEAPEEFTVEQGIHINEEITKVQKENKARVVREGKERRRQWAQKLTPRPSRPDKSIQNVIEMPQESEDNKDMLPDNIVQELAAQEKKVFLSDSEEENAEKRHTSRKKKPKSSGFGPVILSDIPPPLCLQNSLEFLKKRKSQVPRSYAVLNNSSQALRFISTKLLNKK
ncbi:hypothetical protein DCAR_0729500 [Daucus carota subsp. sativus]|uniref:Uncharacterized protein n=1 Tax=Daucus carota subsp. sativus TaxID=79200 RepID=A0AAF1B807_DAUCS|nr:PREDICTED: uncharacterized protein LOC108193738 [Daucus carota subsp. sativus]WOH10039.1 hypothetical protein DCAR_0729500 [Daucus carota subsp. sativus]